MRVILEVGGGCNRRAEYAIPPAGPRSGASPGRGLVREEEGKESRMRGGAGDGRGGHRSRIGTKKTEGRGGMEYVRGCSACVRMLHTPGTGRPDTASGVKLLTFLDDAGGAKLTRLAQRLSPASANYSWAGPCSNLFLWAKQVSALRFSALPDPVERWWASRPICRPVEVCLRLCPACRRAEAALIVDFIIIHFVGR